MEKTNVMLTDTILSLKRKEKSKKLLHKRSSSMNNIEKSILAKKEPKIVIQTTVLPNKGKKNQIENYEINYETLNSIIKNNNSTITIELK